MGYRVARVSFAEPIKRMVAALARENMGIFAHGPKDRPLPALGGLTPREALHTVGMAFRARDADYWVRIAGRTADALMGDARPPVVVFTDVRFDNEADLVTGRGGVLVRVQRPENPVAPVRHLSERVPEGDYYTVLNDGTRRGMEFEARRLADCLVLPARHAGGISIDDATPADWDRVYREWAAAGFPRDPHDPSAPRRPR